MSIRIVRRRRTIVSPFAVDRGRAGGHDHSRRTEREIRDMPRRETVVPEDMKDVHERFRYSPGVKAGPFLFMAGQLGRDEQLNVVEDKEAQFARAFENVEKVLRAAGATFDDVVDMVTYHTDMRDLPLFIGVKDRFFTNPDRLPAWTALGVAALAMPGLFAEIKCTALLPD
jgi:enamine deaminase RidA (YjgF/YER057c/UK114 family)